MHRVGTSSATTDRTSERAKARCLGQVGRSDEARLILDRMAKSYPMRSREIEEVRRSLPAKT